MKTTEIKKKNRKCNIPVVKEEIDNTYCSVVVKI